MGRIDTSELLTDPDFVDEMILIDRTPRITLLGENVLTECIQNSVGCIQPATGKAISRLPEALRNADVCSFWFKGTITASSPGKYSSVLAFRGKRYQVQLVFDWTNWGQGWCEGIAVGEDPS